MVDGAVAGRVWDAFLSERDREHLARGWRKPGPFGLGARPVLLVIDDYRGSLGDRRLPLLEAVEEWPTACGLEGWEAVDRTAELLAVARAAGIPVVHTTNDPAGPPWAIAEGRTQSLIPADGWDRRYDIVDEVAPAPGELVIEKTSPSAFFGTALVAHLTHWGVDTVVACGNSTSGCVRASVVDASSYRYRVAVVEDCCFDRTEAAHALNLFDLDQKYADVISSDEAAAYLRLSRSI